MLQLPTSLKVFCAASALFTAEIATNTVTSANAGADAYELLSKYGSSAFLFTALVAAIKWFRDRDTEKSKQIEDLHKEYKAKQDDLRKEMLDKIEAMNKRELEALGNLAKISSDAAKFAAEADFWKTRTERCEAEITSLREEVKQYVNKTRSDS